MVAAARLRLGAALFGDGYAIATVAVVDDEARLPRPRREGSSRV